MNLNGDVEKKSVNEHDVCISVGKNLLFSNSKLSMHNTLHVTKMWLEKCTNDYFVYEFGGLSRGQI